MILKIGHSYLNRDNEYCVIKDQIDVDLFIVEVKDEKTRTYTVTSKGTYFSNNEQHGNDLITELNESSERS